MKTSVLLFVFCRITLSMAQTTLAGYVTLQNSGNTSAYPAQITSFGATATNVQSTNGWFQLIFDRKLPGQEARLEIVKEDYEVVNREALTVVLPKDQTRQNPLKLFLCPRGQWQRYADQYYRINLMEIQKTYKSELAKLQKKYSSATQDNKTYQQAIVDLDNARKAAETQAQTLAEKFAKANLDDATDRYTAAHRLFTQGKIDSVLLILNEREILADIERAKLEWNQGNEMIRIGKDKMVNGAEAKSRIIEEFMVKARAHVIKFQWDMAERSYEIALKADSTNIYNNVEFGGMLYDLNQFAKARIYVERCLRIAGSDAEKLVPLSNLALIYRAENDHKKAEALNRKALEVCSRLLETHSSYAVDYADILSGLGVLYNEMHDNVQAETAYLQAVEIYQRYQPILPEFIEPKLAVVLSNLGNVYLDRKEYAKAESVFLSALNIRRRLAKNDPVKHEPDLAYTLTSLGILFDKKNDLKAAETAMLEALSIRKRLSQYTPQTFLPLVANSENNLGNLYIKARQYPKADSCFLDALRIRRELAQQNPLVFESELATLLNNVGIFYYELQELARSEAVLLEVLAIRKRIFHQNPSVIEPAIAGTLNNLGVLYTKTGSHEMAEKVFLEALEIQKRYLKTDSLAFKPHVAETLNNLGALYNATRRYDMAETVLLDARRIRAQLAQTEPEAFLVYLADTENNLGNTYRYTRQFNKAETAYSNTLQTYRKIAADAPGLHEDKVAKSLRNLGVLHRDYQRFTQAKGFFEKEVTLWQRLLPENPVVYSQYLSQAYNLLADVYTRSGSPSESFTTYQAMFDFFTQLSVSNPTAYQIPRAEALNSIGSFFNNMHDNEKASENYYKALRILNNCTSGDSVCRKNLAVVYHNLANVYNDLGQFDSAVYYYTSAIAIKRAFYTTDSALHGLSLSTSLLEMGNLYGYYGKSEVFDFFKEAYEIANTYPNNPQAENIKNFIIKKVGIEKCDPTFYAYSERIAPLYVGDFPSEKDKIAPSLKIIAIWEEAHALYPQNQQINKELANCYANLAWYRLFDLHFSDSEKDIHSSMALAHIDRIESTLMLSLLYQNKTEEALAIIRTLKDQPYSKQNLWRDVFYSDLRTLLESGISCAGANAAMELLSQ